MKNKNILKYLLIIPALISLFFVQIELKKEKKTTWEIIKENNLVSF